MSEGTNNTEKKGKLMGLWTLCSEAKDAIVLKLELQKSKASSKKTIVKIEDRIIDAGDAILELQTKLAEVESVVGKAWCPLTILKAKNAIKDKEAEIEELETLIVDVKEVIKEYIG